LIVQPDPSVARREVQPRHEVCDVRIAKAVYAASLRRHQRHTPACCGLCFVSSDHRNSSPPLFLRFHRTAWPISMQCSASRRMANRASVDIGSSRIRIWLDRYELIASEFNHLIKRGALVSTRPVRRPIFQADFSLDAQGIARFARHIRGRLSSHWHKGCISRRVAPHSDESVQCITA
jgi:hypothetical protein